MKKQVIYTLITLALGSFVIFFLFSNKPKAIPAEIPAPKAQHAKALKVSPDTYQLNVYSYGSIQPKRQFDFISEVSGRVINVNTNFTNGGRFDTDEVLFSIDKTDFELALVQAKSNVAHAKQQLATLQGEARQAKREWRDLGDSDANDLFLKKPQIENAKAQLVYAQAQVSKAQSDLNKTDFKLPYSGRIVNKSAVLGQFIAQGHIVATIYSDDIMQARLALSDRQLQLLQIDVGQSLNLLVRFKEAAGDNEWHGAIHNFESSFDNKTRLLYAIAEIDQSQQDTPVIAGKYINAEITGLQYTNLYRIPRQALRPRNQVWIADEEFKLRFITPEIVHSDNNYVYFKWAAQEALQVITSPITLASSGILLSITEQISINDPTR